MTCMTAPNRELQIFSPDGKLKTVRLDGDRMSLGRSSTGELAFPEDAGLSRQHLLLEREGDGWSVRDLGSKNGTLVNGVRLTAKLSLKSGDRITAGHLVMVYGDSTIAPTGVVFVDQPESDGKTSSTVITSLPGAAEESENAVTGAKRVAALIKAGRELAGHRPLQDLFPFILELSIEAVGAQRGVLMTLENHGELVARAAHGDNFRISTTVRDRVLQNNNSVLVRDAQQDEEFRSRKSIVAQSIRSMMAVPLQAKERIIGLIYVDSPDLFREFTKEDLSLLTVMANVAAIRIEHARLIEVEQTERMLNRDLEQAAEIQRRFLPADAPEIIGLDLAGYNAPCRTVGGDYYDFFSYPNRRVALALGDVSGKGLPASLMMTNLQARVQVLAQEPTNLAGLISSLNRLTASTCPSNCFITFFFCVLDAASGKLIYCNAGHNPGMLMRRNGKLETLSAGGLVLGVMPAAKYEEARLQIEQGDVLLLYSDGVTEAYNAEGEEFGEERLATVLRNHRGESAQKIIQALNRTLLEWTGGGAPADDLTLVVAKKG